MSARVLFATSNGTGLGHLNRAMAIARRLPGGYEPSFFTLSQAAPTVAAQGYEIDYLASYRRPGSGTDRAWNLRLRAMLEQLVDEERPDAIVFDGVHPYRALTHVLSRSGAPPSVWSRRPMWREGSAQAPLHRTGAFDAVLEPGELAASADRGPTVPRRAEATRVRPIVLLDRGDLLHREAAAAELGLDPAKRTALVSLGQGGQVDRAVARSLAALAAQPDLQVAALQSSLAAGLEVPAGVVRLRATFPMSRYFNAFDLAIAASGYNAFHELIASAVPTLFVPMPRDTDDQAARARWADREGVGLAVRGADDPELDERIGRLCDPGVGASLRERCEERFPGNGAAEAAALVAALAEGRSTAPPTRRTGRFNRWLRLSAHPVGPTLPLVMAMGGRDLLRHPERRSPRLLVLALGVAPGELVARLEAAMGGTERGRVLVVTDSFDFAALRELGVGFEHLPAMPGGRRPTDPEMTRLAARLRLLIRGRKPLRALALGDAAAELLGVSELPGRVPEAS